MSEIYLCEFEYGYEGQFYQEVLNGQVVRYADLDGNTLTLEGAYGCRIINPNPDRPSWVQ
jgi:hypothetical protein